MPSGEMFLKVMVCFPWKKKVSTWYNSAEAKKNQSLQKRLSAPSVSMVRVTSPISSESAEPVYS